MSSLDLVYRRGERLLVDQQGHHINDSDDNKPANGILEPTQKRLSKNDSFIDNCRAELNTIHHANIDMSNLKHYESPRCDTSYNTFLTAASRSFASYAASPQSLTSTCADLDDVYINDVTHPDQSEHSSGGLISEASCSKNTSSSSTSENETSNVRQLCDDEKENSNLSWLSRSLCGMHSSSVLENIDDESVDTSFHTAACMPKFLLKENTHRDKCAHDNEEKSEYFTSVRESTACLTRNPDRTGKHSTCLVCSKDVHVCDCLENVVDCSCTEVRSNRRIAIDGHNDTELTAVRFLDANGIWCNSWPDWYPDEDGHDILINSIDSAPVLENRARDMNTRRRRLERLRMNLTPFSFLEEELNEGAVNMERYKRGKWARSLSDISPKSVVTSSATINKPVSQMQFHCESMNCGDEQEEIHMNALSLIHNAEEKDTGYDSDPSEILCRTKISHPKGVRRISTFSSLSDSAKKELDYTSFFGKMHGLMNSRKTLVWHGTEDNTQEAVKAWIEPGSQLQSVLIQPKFMWQQTLGKDKRDTERRVLKARIFHSLDLLDITKIVATEQIDRVKYPFAKRSCSFVVQSFEKELVFEAVCETERDDIVDGLKMMVARLGSKILVGDGQVLNEFFTPMGASVPGDVPAFITEGNFGTADVEY